MGLMTAVRSAFGRPTRPVRTINNNSISLAPTFDYGTADYAFWDRLRKGRATGLEIAGLLLRPLESKIASWTLGTGPTIVLKNANAQKFITSWIQEHLPEILPAVQDSIGLGDAFILVNPDLSVISFPPETVAPVVDEDDYTKLLGWKVTQVINHPSTPNKKMVIENSYTKTKRTKKITVNNKTIFNRSYNNFIGRCPLIHVPNNAASNERFGHPEAEAMVNTLIRYNELVLAAIHGNIRQGRPTPVIHGLGTPQEVELFWQQNARTITNELPDGRVETEEVIEFDADRVIALGGTADFKWEAPGQFTEDTRNLLSLLFYLYLQHSELPEFILGNAVDVSSDPGAQIEPLVKFIDKRRMLLQPWLKELCEVALAYNGLSDIASAKDQGDDLRIFWGDLTRQDGTLTLQTVQWAYMQGLLDRKLALALMPLEVADPEQALKDAEEDYPNRPVQGYPTAGGSGNGGVPQGGDPQNTPGENSERSRRRSGVGRNGRPRNRRSDSRNPSPQANAR